MMMNRQAAPLLVTFALTDESRAFIRLLSNPVRLAPHDHLSPVSGELSGRPVIVLHTGAGDSAACQHRLTAMLESKRPRLVISSGYAGGLDPALRVGDLLLAQNRSDPTLSAAVQTNLDPDSLFNGALSTQPAAAETVAAKAALHASTGALGVDMETVWIAAACVRAGIPLVSLRVISDAADRDFPVPNRILYDLTRQRPRFVALPLYLLTHPTRIRAFIDFVRGLNHARAQLTRSLARLIMAL
ncbi:MAG: hypothetical protein INR62_02505 [Rhodospirillales bacterium]|nr:hypothetical protein [Acetobacter sp.]